VGSHGTILRHLGHHTGHAFTWPIGHGPWSYSHIARPYGNSNGNGNGNGHSWEAAKEAGQESTAKLGTVDTNTQADLDNAFPSEEEADSDSDSDSNTSSKASKAGSDSCSDSDFGHKNLEAEDGKTKTKKDKDKGKKGSKQSAASSPAASSGAADLEEAKQAKSEAEAALQDLGLLNDDALWKKRFQAKDVQAKHNVASASLTKIDNIIAKLPETSPGRHDCHNMRVKLNDAITAYNSLKDTLDKFRKPQISSLLSSSEFIQTVLEFLNKGALTIDIIDDILRCVATKLSPGDSSWDKLFSFLKMGPLEDVLNLGAVAERLKASQPRAYSQERFLMIQRDCIYKKFEALKQAKNIEAGWPNVYFLWQATLSGLI
jgi:hypothetical protein